MSGLTKKVNAKPYNHWNSYNLCSMIKTTSMGGAHYFMTFINNYNHYTWVCFLKLKSQAHQCFKSFKIIIELKFDRKVKTLQNDRGGKYLSRKFVNFYSDQGIKRKFTQGYTPHQNGICRTKESDIAQEGEIHGV